MIAGCPTNPPPPRQGDPSPDRHLRGLGYFAAKHRGWIAARLDKGHPLIIDIAQGGTPPRFGIVLGFATLGGDPRAMIGTLR